MKLISFHHDGTTGYGAVIGDRVANFAAIPGAPADLKAALAAGVLTNLAARAEPSMALADVALLPVLPNPGKILCVGHNYEDHRKETNRAKTDYPSIFTRWADTQIAAGAPILRPRESTMLDYEGELLIVIGKGGRRINETDALGHIAGYACANDASVRDFQWHTSQFAPGKNFPGTCASGPWLVTLDEIGAIDDKTITTRLNGTIVQQASFAQLIFPLAKIIAYCSTFTALSPGDVILTGTPGGVGAKREPSLWMKAGDTIEVTIDDIGTLSNPVRDEA